MTQSNATLPRSAFSAAISMGVQLACALIDSEKCPKIASGGTATDFDEATWDRLYDLAVVRQLEVWEENGFRAHIEAGLPSAKEAAAISGRQSSDAAWTIKGAEPLIFDEPPPCPTGPMPETAVDIRVTPDSLLAQFAEFFVGHCAWRSRELLAADIFVQIEDEDALVDALAAFLWRHRDQLPPSGEIFSR